MQKYLILLLLIIPLTNVLSDELKLNDGSVIKGEIIKENNNEIIIETSYGKQTIPISDIKEIIRDKSQEIHLKDGSIIKGTVINQNQETVTIKTKYGTSEISNNDIKEIKFVKETNNNETPSLETEMQGMGKAFLYESQKKDIGVGLGLQMLGGGLLYVEKYGAGATMFALENGLLISSMFVNDPDAQTGLLLGGILLKGINTFFTIKSINNYNQDVRYRLGINHKNKKIKKSKIQSYSAYFKLLSSNFGYKYTGEHNKNISRVLGFKLGTNLNYKNNFAISLGYSQRGSARNTNKDIYSFIDIGIVKYLYLNTLINKINNNTIVFGGVDFEVFLFNKNYHEWAFNPSTLGVNLGLGYKINDELSILSEVNIGSDFKKHYRYKYQDFGLGLIYVFKYK